MITTCANFKVVVNGRESIWVLPQDTPVADAKEILFQYQKIVAQVEDHAKAQADAIKIEEKIPEPTEQVCDECK